MSQVSALNPRSSWKEPVESYDELLGRDDELQKTVAVFFPPPRHPTKGDAEKAKSSAKGRRSGHGFRPVTREERPGQLSWVKRRRGGELMAAREDLKESYKMTESNSSWWRRTAQEGKNSQFLHGRLGLAVRKSFFSPGKRCSTGRGAQRGGKAQLPRTKPGCSVRLQAELWARDPQTASSHHRSRHPAGVLGQRNGRHRSSWSAARLRCPYLRGRGRGSPPGPAAGRRG